MTAASLDGSVLRRRSLLATRSSAAVELTSRAESESEEGLSPMWCRSLSPFISNARRCGCKSGPQPPIKGGACCSMVAYKGGMDCNGNGQCEGFEPTKAEKTLLRKNKYIGEFLDIEEYVTPDSDFILREYTTEKDAKDHEKAALRLLGHPHQLPAPMAPLHPDKALELLNLSAVTSPTLRRAANSSRASILCARPGSPLYTDYTPMLPKHLQRSELGEGEPVGGSDGDGVAHHRNYSQAASGVSAEEYGYQHLQSYGRANCVGLRDTATFSRALLATRSQPSLSGGVAEFPAAVMSMLELDADAKHGERVRLNGACAPACVCTCSSAETGLWEGMVSSHPTAKPVC